MTPEEQKRDTAIHHVVHEYANFVSSAEMGSPALISAVFLSGHLSIRM